MRVAVLVSFALPCTRVEVSVRKGCKSTAVLRHRLTWMSRRTVEHHEAEEREGRETPSAAHTARNAHSPIRRINRRLRVSRKANTTGSSGTRPRLARSQM